MALRPGDKSQIAWLVGRERVGTPDREIAQAFARRVAKIPTMTPATARAVIAHAVKVHQKNRGDYRAVMAGRFGKSKGIPDGTWP